MGEKEVERTLKFIKKSLKKDVHLMFYGGEPLLADKVCRKIVEETSNYCNECGVSLNPSIITNGLLITEDIIDNLFNPYDFKFIQITLDGCRKDHDLSRIYPDGSPTYDLILEKIKMLDDEGLPVRIRIHVNKQNINGLEELMDDLKSLKLRGAEMYLARLSSLTDACKDLAPICFAGPDLVSVEDKLNSLMKGNLIRPSQRFCCMFETDDSFIIDPSLDLYKCLALLADDEYKVGSIDHQGNAQFNRRFYSVMNRDPLDHAKCRKCFLLPLCSGGCAAKALGEKKDFREYYCGTVKYLVRNDIRKYVRGKFNV